MKLVTENAVDESLVTVCLGGRFDAHETGRFRHEFDLLMTPGTERVAVELSAVNFIDSAGLAELVRAMKKLRQRGGDLLLVNVSDPVRIILELTRLDVAFTLQSR